MNIPKVKKVVFLDVDGTLLDENKELPDSAIEAIREMKAAGNLCFLSTGRNLAQIREFDFLNLDGAILLNGAAVFLNGEMIINNVLESRQVRQLLEYAEAIGAGVHILTLNNVYSDDNWNRQKISFLKSCLQLTAEAFEKRAKEDSPIDWFNNEDVYKIDIRFPSIETRESYRNMVDDSVHMFSDSGYYSRGGSYYAEVNRSDSSKGIAVESLLKILKIDRENAYGFGDSNNDISMLQACGNRVVVENGTQAVKEYADLIADRPENDGIYKAVKTLGLDR